MERQLPGRVISTTTAMGNSARFISSLPLLNASRLPPEFGAPRPSLLDSLPLLAMSTPLLISITDSQRLLLLFFTVLQFGIRIRSDPATLQWNSCAFPQACLHRSTSPPARSTNNSLDDSPTEPDSGTRNIRCHFAVGRAFQYRSTLRILPSCTPH